MRTHLEVMVGARSFRSSAEPRNAGWQVNIRHHTPRPTLSLYCLTLDTVLVLRSGASTLPSLSLGKKEAVTASGRGVRSKEAALRMQQQPGAWELELEGRECAR